mmetsp:Transcript_9762/g.29283  ORF Transcript_9762/g.29283 Transcript_9762/m.29283 type:complete len:235 (+) Transcript_9762:942-1646(+)
MPERRPLRSRRTRRRSPRSARGDVHGADRGGVGTTARDGPRAPRHVPGEPAGGRAAARGHHRLWHGGARGAHVLQLPAGDGGVARETRGRRTVVPRGAVDAVARLALPLRQAPVHGARALRAAEAVRRLRGRRLGARDHPLPPPHGHAAVGRRDGADAARHALRLRPRRPVAGTAEHVADLALRARAGSAAEAPHGGPRRAVDAAGAQGAPVVGRERAPRLRARLRHSRVRRPC